MHFPASLFPLAPLALSLGYGSGGWQTTADGSPASPEVRLVVVVMLRRPTLTDGEGPAPCPAGWFLLLRAPKPVWGAGNAPLGVQGGPGQLGEKTRARHVWQRSHCAVQLMRHDFRGPSTGVGASLDAVADKLADTEASHFETNGRHQELAFLADFGRQYISTTPELLQSWGVRQATSAGSQFGNAYHALLGEHDWYGNWTQGAGKVFVRTTDQSRVNVTSRAFMTGVREGLVCMVGKLADTASLAAAWPGLGTEKHASCAARLRGV